MQDKNSKSISQVTRNEPEQGFALCRSDTIQLWSWLEGNQQLDDQSLKSLSEDISYRIRESLDNAVSLMHQCKRFELKTTDVNQAFKILNIEKTFGYNAKEPLDYKIIKTDEINDKILNQFKSKFFELNDTVIELNLEEKDAIEKNENFLHGNWFVVNGNSVDYRNNANDPNVTIDFDESENEDIEGRVFYPQLNHDFKEYYKKVTSVIMGEHDSPSEDQEMFNMVLGDFRTNSKLQPVVAYLINFFHQTVQILTLNISDIKKEIEILDYLGRVLCAIKNLILNKNVFLAPKGFLTKILSTLLYCCIQNFHLGINFSLEIRQKSAFILVMFLKLYEKFSTETIKYILTTFIKPSLNENKLGEKQIATLIGVASLLFNFGGQIIDEYYTEITKLTIELEKMNGRSKPMAVILKQIFLECFTRHFKWMLRKNLSETQNSSFSFKRILNFYKNLVDDYGDSFVNQILNLNDSFRYSNFFELKLGYFKSEWETYRIKLRSLPKVGEYERNKVEDIFEQYSRIQKKDFNIKFGKIIRLKKSNDSIKNENVILEEPKIILAKYLATSKREKKNYEQNLSYFYKDTFL